MRNYKKIFNDPLYGLVTIYHPLLMDIIDSEYFQRLRRITQLGMSSFVYPSAVHTRFQHALGAMHLMSQAIKNLKMKNIEITEEEEEATLIAILLHDIGHSPFSHTLENSIIKDVNHEQISLFIMEKLNIKFNKKLELAISIFKGNYHKKFLHELISGELDVDRMDYLSRDSFFTGVNEGIIGTDRIINLLDVVDNQIVVEEKGIHSILKFIVSRTIMYLQVYYHKTTICADILLINILKRAKDIIIKGQDIEAPENLKFFIINNISLEDFKNKPEIVEKFLSMDDSDIISAIKIWTKSKDKILSDLSKKFLNRNLFKLNFLENPLNENEKNNKISEISKKLNLNNEEIKYYINFNNFSVNPYQSDHGSIKILLKNNRKVIDFIEVSKQFSLPIETKKIIKYYFCSPKY